MSMTNGPGAMAIAALLLTRRLPSDLVTGVDVAAHMNDHR